MSSIDDENTGNNINEKSQKQILCQVLNVSLSVGFLNQKINQEWKKSCCENHRIFLADYVFKSILEELNEPGQRTPTRLLDLSMAVKRLAIIFREENLEYNLTLAILMKEYITRYIRDPIPIVCHTVLDTLDNFIQSKLNLIEANGSNGENVLESLCQMFLQRTTKFTIRALILFMKHTHCDLIDEDIWTRFYSKIGAHELTSAITDLIIFHGIKLASEDKGLGLHLNEMRRCLLDGSIEIRRAIQTKLLPKMFKSVELRNILNNESMILLNVHDDFYASANPIRAIEVVLSMTKFFIFNPTSTALSWHDCVDVQLLAEAVVVDDIEVRMLGWQLICQNPRLTRPFSYDELLLARLFITSNMTEQNPGIRQKMVAEFKVLMQRMRESYKQLKKKMTPENRDLFYELATSELFPAKTEKIIYEESPCNEILLENHKHFLKFIHDFVFDSIGRESNFNRKLSALFLIEMMHDSEASYKNGAADLMYDELEMQSWLNQECYDRLKAVLNDEYEINQGLAEKLLSKLQFTNIERPHYEDIPLDFKNNYYKSRCFWKDVYAGGEQHLQAMIKHVQILIEKEIQKIQQHNEEYLGGHISLTNLIIYLNGFFESKIYYQLKNIEPWETYIPKTLIPLCLTVGKLVSPVVHSCAPEGYYPDDHSEDIDGQKASERAKKAQQLLVNCWRTHKEISIVFKNFFNYAFENDPAQSLSKVGMKLLPPNLLQNLIDYLWIQLTECRHCGAFESAALTFQIVCSILWKLEDSKNLPNDYSIVDSPIKVLDKLIRSLEGEDEALGICETRRSAGIPPLFVAILTTEPKKNNRSEFAKTLERMFAINSQDPSMIIHTINCLVAIFECSDLSHVVKQFLTPAFLLCFCEPPEVESSTISFTDHWPIRNTISRLFNAVIRRMFGSPNKSQKSLFISQRCTKPSNDVFIQLPSLYKTMKELFQSYVEDKPNPRNEFHMYPLLTMLTHVTPSNTADYQLSVFHPYLIRILLQSKGQKIRELSAVALITTSQECEFVSIVQWLSDCNRLKVIKSSNNAIDGCLLLLNLCLEQHGGDIPEPIIDCLQQFFQALWEIIDVQSLADITLYYFFIAAKSLANENDLQMIANMGIEMLQNETFLNEKQLSFSGFADLFVTHQNLWGERKDNLPLNFRLECYHLANELNVKLLDQLYKDLAEVKSDEDIFRVLQPLTVNHDYLDEEIIPTIESLFDSQPPLSEIYFALMECFTYLRAEKKLTKKEIERVKIFFDEASASYEDEIRLKAIRIWLITATTHRNSKIYDEFMSKAIVWLQDGCPQIRAEVAKAMNEWLLSTELCLNPTILWSFAATNDSKLIEQLFYGKFERTKETFQRTALNPFAEKSVLPEMQILSDLLIAIERYKARHREEVASRKSL